MLKLWKPIAGQATSTHEDLFVQHYDHLLDWALRLTNGDRERAEDLVQDAFVQFTFIRPNLSSIQNLEGYLYGMLRNLQLMDLRRATHQRTESLSLIDYDSAELGLKSRDVSLEIQTRNELALICQYACQRKKTSKAGSVLILRFFHGYYPSEIARVIQSSRPVVSELIKVARNEARQFVENPGALGFMRNETETLPLAIDSGVSHDQLLRQLRGTIFSSRVGACFSSRALKALYETRQPIDGQTLAHLVSCRQCLDGVNALLGLPLLAERYPTDMLSPDKPAKGGGGGPSGGGTTGGSSSSDVIKKCRRRAKGVFEHRPRELCVSVNGDVQVWQTVASEVTEQTVSLEVADEVNLVEVSSEQGIRLMLLEVETPIAGPVEQTASVELSEGRFLQVSLDHSALRPRLHMLYQNPSFNEVATTEESATEARGSSPTPGSPAPGSPAGQPRWGGGGQPGWGGAVREGLDEKVQGSRFKKQERLAEATRLWRRLRRRRFDFALLLKPGTLTALIALMLIASLLIWKTRGPAPAPIASDLLRQSSEADEAFFARTDTVIHRTINLEERNVRQTSSLSNAGEPNPRELIARRRIEVWHSAEKGITARRLYDDKNNLIAGDWRRSDGVQTLYHHGARPQLQIRNPQSAIRNFDDVWREDVGAKDFIQMIGNAQAARVEELASTYLITYVGNESSAGSGLVRASLVVSKADLHATELTLVLNLREYRFVEASFERHSPATVAPSVFEPESELLSTAKPETLNLKPETNSSPLPLTALPRTVATAALEVQVLTLLQQAGADLGEQVGVTRTPEGALYIKGLVDTDQRKNEILHALEPVRHNAAVKIDISTAAEALARQKRQPTDTAGSALVQVESANGKIPVYSDLHRYLSARGVSEVDIDGEASRIAIRASARARLSLQHAWALKRIAQRFSLEDLRTLDPQARERWLGLVRAHASAIQREDSMLRAELQPIFQTTSAGAKTGELDLNSDAALIQSIQHLFDLCVANDSTVRAAFTVSADSSSGAAVKAPQFWHALADAEKLAARISRQ